MREKEYDKWILSKFIRAFLSIFCLLSIVAFVAFAGFTIGLIVMWIVKGSDFSSYNLTFFMEVLSNYSNHEITNLINEVGVNKVALAGCGYGFAMAFTSTMLYIILSRARSLFDSIVEGDTFTKENIMLINDTLPITVLYALTQPVIMFVVSSVTGVYNLEDIYVGGLVILFIAYVIKFIFDNGYELAKESVKYEKKERDFKASTEETELELIKKDAQIKALKASEKELRAEVESLMKKVPKEKKTTTTKKTTTKAKKTTKK